MYTVNIFGHEIKIEANSAMFSPNSLDKGTEVMLRHIDLTDQDKVLDLGCGSGVVGIAVAKQIGGSKVFMSDVDAKAVAAAEENAKLNESSDVTIIESDGFKNILEKDFTLILSNPPYHTDFSVAKQFIEEGKMHLVNKGRMVLVVKRLDWYKNKMTSVFGGAKVLEEEGYFVIVSEKREGYNSSILTKPVNKKHLKKLQKSAKNSKAHK